jgi:hypothetical protein
MEYSKWFDLGKIGHKSEELSEITMSEYLATLPEHSDSETETKFMVFVNYTSKQQMGTKVFTNAFDTQEKFNEYLLTKIIERYVKINKPLDFNKDF